MSLYVHQATVDAVQWRPCRPHPMVERLADGNPLAGRYAFIGKDGFATIESGDWIVTDLDAGTEKVVPHATFARHYSPVRNS